jgi:hypothetical protein
MHRSQYFGYLAYPLFLFVFLWAPGLFAQSSTGTQPPTQQQSQPSSEQQPENPQQEQVRIAQQAQARIRARRRARVQKVVEDTYSHKFELYGGGGYMRFRPGPYLQQTNQAAWNVGFTDYRWSRLGITADLRGYYGNAYVGLNPYNVFKPAIDEYTFMAGPQYRFVRRIHWAISGQALVGVTKGIFNGNSAQLPGTLVGLWPNATAFTVGVAAPVDYNLGPGLAIRIAPNYLFTTFGSSIQTKNLGFTSGLVVRFGRR